MKNAFGSVVALLCLIFSMTQSYAAALPFSGYYVGGMIGPSLTYGSDHRSGSANATLDTSVTPPLLLNAPLQTSSGLFKFSPGGELFVGLGSTFQNYYFLGGEFFISLADGHMSNDLSLSANQNLAGVLQFGATANVDTTVELSSLQYGIRLRPGILITPNTVLFAIIGTSIAKLKLQTNPSLTTNMTTAGSAVTNTLSFPISTSKTRAALVLGFGLEHAFALNWAVRMDYLYTYFGKVSLNRTSQTSFIIPGPVDLSGAFNFTAQHAVRVSNQAVMLGLVYRA